MQSRQVGNLRVAAVTAVQKKDVPADLRSIRGKTDGLILQAEQDSLNEPPLVHRAEHVEHEDFVVAITVDIGDVEAHRKTAGARKRRTGQGAESAFTVVDPTAVHAPKIAAHVDVRGAIPVEIADGNRVTPVFGRLAKRPTRLVQECPVGPGHRPESALSIIQITEIWFAKLPDEPVGRDIEPVAVFRSDHALTAAHNEIEPGAADCCGPVIGDVEVDGAVAIQIAQRHADAPELPR